MSIRTPLPAMKQTGAEMRDPSVDALRFVGITSIFLAHIGPPDALFQLRSFDVPLMVFVSGLSYSGRQIADYGAFLRKRVLRLLTPLYLFLAAYLLVMYLLSQFDLVAGFSTKRIVGTLMLRLQPSIGYVWIFRVFLIVMLLTPLLLRLERAVRRDGLFIALIAAMCGAQALLVWWLKPLHLGFAVDDWALYAIGYSIPFLVGVRLRYADRRRSLLVGGVFAAAMICAAFVMTDMQGTWVKMQPWKYPPRLYFLLWGTTVSVVLWSLRRYWVRLISCRLVLFIGQNTIWLYLWHIPFAKLVKTSMAGYWWGFRLLTIYGIALVLCSIQYRIVDALAKRTGSGFLKYLKG